jgi:preprotein translocase subunit SecG
MALAFFGDPTPPAQCALEIAAGLKSQPHSKHRIGIHGGPVVGIPKVRSAGRWIPLKTRAAVKLGGLTAGGAVSYTESTPMYALVMTIHVVVCVFLIIVVLLQSGKAADLAGAFGGMGSQTAFGPRGSATLLSKATTVSAVLFMVTSLSLSILATRNAGLGTTVLDTTQQKPMPVQQTQAPAQAPASGPVPININTTQSAPASTTPVQVDVKPQPTGKAGEVQIDMSHIKVPTPSAPPADQKKK